MFILIFGGVTVGVLLWWAHRLDRRGSTRGLNPDAVRNRVEGGMVMGQSWRTPRNRS